MRFYTRLFISVLLILFVTACTQEIDNTGNANITGSTGPATTTSDPSKPTYIPPTNTGDTSGGGSTSTGTPAGIDSVTITDTVQNLCVDSNIVVNFTATPSRKIKNATYEWYFGDNSPSITSGPASVTNIYALAGTYSVLVKVDSGGRSLISNTIKITLVGAANTPVAAFTAVTTNPNSGGNIYAFNSKSTLSSSYNWSFGDGNTLPTTSTYVTHPYVQQSSAQTFVVTLTAINSGGCTGTATKIITIPAK